MTNKLEDTTVLAYPNGQSVTWLEEGLDERGAYLIVEHRIVRKGAVNGPHWHPELTERFAIREGRIRFERDGEEVTLGTGGELTILPGQVHQFWKEGDEPLVMLHEIRPPGKHWEMFVLIHKLETEGKTAASGIPRNPLWLGLAWETMDGYLKGPPILLQKLLLGGLARLARKLGYDKK